MLKIPLILFLLASGAAAQVVSEQNEGERMKTILSPKLNPASDVQNKSFYGGRDFGYSANSSQAKTFSLRNIFNSKAFNTKKFGATSYWTGEYVKGGEKASIKGDYAIPSATERYTEKTNPVNKDRDSDKTQETRNYDKNREYLIKGKSQKILDAQQEAQTPLTVDEVRKILNTTK